LNKYYEEIGGKPRHGVLVDRESVPAPKTVTKKEPVSSRKSKKRAAEDSPPADTSKSRRRSKGQKRIKAEDSEIGNEGEGVVVDGVKGKMVTLPSGSWEDRINSISTITKEEDGTLIATVIWDDGTHQKHTAKVLNMRCPQRMLHFYESHL